MQTYVVGFDTTWQNVWHEASDYSADQIMFEIGTIIGQESLPKNNFKIMSRSNKLIWSTPVDQTAWQNFAIMIDYTKKYEWHLYSFNLFDLCC
jgi:hypothetical protein